MNETSIPGLIQINSPIQIPDYTAIINCFSEYYQMYGYTNAPLTMYALWALISICALIIAVYFTVYAFNHTEKKAPERYFAAGMYILIMCTIALFVPLTMSPIVIVFAVISAPAAYKVYKKYDAKKALEK